MSEVKILIVEDIPDMADLYVMSFRRRGIETAFASSGYEALEAIHKDSSIRIVLTDLKMPGMDGVELLEEIKKYDPEIQVVIMTGYGTIPNAVQALKRGATDYVTKPLDKSELVQAVEKIINMHNVQEEAARRQAERSGPHVYGNIIGRSRRMQEVFEKITAIASVDSSALICGESGTGKELVARAIHYNGDRAHGPFVPVHCGALPGELIESELFGYKKGAFTGAARDYIGLFRSADLGTIFLDELTEMPQTIQAKLLRVLQDKKVRPVGATEEIAVDVRIVAATNEDVSHALKTGALREDLYYRLSVVQIHLPPLRQRREDIAFLVQHFIEKLNQRFQRKVQRIDPDALDLLRAYPWPGNVRELENVMEGIFILKAPSDAITLWDLPPNLRARTKFTTAAYETASGPTQSLNDAEREAVEKALRAAQGNKSKAAEMLGISRSRLYKKIQMHKIEVSSRNGA